MGAQTPPEVFFGLHEFLLKIDIMIYCLTESRSTDGPDILAEANQHRRIKGPARAAPDHPHRLPQRVGGFIDAGAEQRVKGVRQPHSLDPGGNLRPGQPVRVAGAVPTLMVVAADVADIS